MPDTPLIDEATRYLLNELGSAEQRVFERELNNSPELRKLVKELEEGTVALALTSKRRQAPSEVWDLISTKLEPVTAPRTLKVLWRLPLLRNGWAFAGMLAICLIIALVFAHKSRVTQSPVTQLLDSSQQSPVVVQSSRTVSPVDHAMSEAQTSANLLRESLQEIGALKLQVAQMSNRLVQLSNTITQQEAHLNARDQVRFFTMTSGGNAMGNPAVRISPALQHALLLAMARELGWYSRQESDTRPSEVPSHSFSSSPETNQVIFVDLPPSAPESMAQPSMESLFTAMTETPTQEGTSGSIPGFFSGTNAVLAFDDTIVPIGTSLGFWTESPTDGPLLIGTTSISSQPIVVTIPAASGYSSGSSIVVTAQNPNGTTTVFQFPGIGTGTPQNPSANIPVNNNPQPRQQ